MNQTYKVILLQYALQPSLPIWEGKGGVIWGDLEVCSLKTMMFEKHPSISPYTYCANNPIKYIDPTGEDEYEFDKKGNLLNIITNDKADIIRVVNRKGKEIASNSYACGTVQNITSDQKKLDKTTLSIKDNANRKDIFEFLATNTKVEWMTISANNGNEEKNYISTSINSDHVWSNLPMTLYNDGFTATEYSHSHPSRIFGSNCPTGYGFFGDKKGGGDFESFTGLKQMWKDINVSVYDANNGHYYQLGRTMNDIMEIDMQGNKKPYNPY